MPFFNFKMFFVEGRYEKLPKKVKKEVNKLHLLDRYIFESYQKGKRVDRLVIDYVVSSLKIFLRFYDELKRPLKKYMEEAVGEIPITFFTIDNLKVDEEIEESVDPLIDMADSQALKELDRKDLAKKTLKRLEELRKKFRVNGFVLKSDFPDYSKNKYFGQNDKFLEGLNDLSLKKEVINLKKDIMKYEEDYNKIIRFSSKKRDLRKEIINFFTSIIKLSLKIKNRHIKKRYIDNLLEYLSFLFYSKKIKMSLKLREVINEFIDIGYIENIDRFLNQKLKELENIQKE